MYVRAPEAVASYSVSTVPAPTLRAAYLRAIHGNWIHIHRRYGYSCAS